MSKRIKIYTLNVTLEAASYWNAAVQQVGGMTLFVRGDTPLSDIIEKVGEHNPTDPAEDAWQDGRRLDSEAAFDGLGLVRGDQFTIQGGTRWHVEVIDVLERPAGEWHTPFLFEDEEFNYDTLQEVEELASQKYDPEYVSELQLASRVVVYGVMEDSRTGDVTPIIADWRVSYALTLGDLYSIVLVETDNQIPRDCGRIHIHLEDESNIVYDCREPAPWKYIPLDSVPRSRGGFPGVELFPPLDVVAATYALGEAEGNGVSAVLHLQVYDNTQWLKARGIDIDGLVGGLATEG